MQYKVTPHPLLSLFPCFAAFFSTALKHTYRTCVYYVSPCLFLCCLFLLTPILSPTLLCLDQHLLCAQGSWLKVLVPLRSICILPGTPNVVVTGAVSLSPGGEIYLGPKLFYFWSHCWFQPQRLKEVTPKSSPGSVNSQLDYQKGRSFPSVHPSISALRWTPIECVLGRQLGDLTSVPSSPSPHPVGSALDDTAPTAPLRFTPAPVSPLKKVDLWESARTVLSLAL